MQVQRVNLPRGNGNTKRKLTVNMGLNILLKYCVFTAARQYYDVPCLVYTLALAIMLKYYNARYVEHRFSIYKQNVLNRVHKFLTGLISWLSQWTLPSTPNLSHSSPELQTNRC